MFTGIIQSVSRVIKHENKKGSLFLTIEKPRGWKVKPGDSIATNGACLTVIKSSPKEWQTELMTETLENTTFGKEVPEYVNLEQSLKLSDRVDGHFVTGHVDCVGKIVEITKKKSGTVFKVSFPKKFNKLVARKGSVAIDGISLTIASCGPGWLTVSLVNYSMDHTNLSKKQKGDTVNIEFDLIAKYSQI